MARALLLALVATSLLGCNRVREADVQARNALLAAMQTEAEGWQVPEADLRKEQDSLSYYQDSLFTAWPRQLLDTRKWARFQADSAHQAQYLKLGAQLASLQGSNAAQLAELLRVRTQAMAWLAEPQRLETPANALNQAWQVKQTHVQRLLLAAQQGPRLRRDWRRRYRAFMLDFAARGWYYARPPAPRVLPAPAPSPKPAPTQPGSSKSDADEATIPADSI